MRRDFDNQSPRVADDAFVSEMAYLVGDVTVESDASLWPFVCLRGDGGSTRVGTGTNVQEFSMLHGADVGDRVTVGHNVVIDYAEIQDDVLVGMQSAVMSGATVESNSIVAAGSIVLTDQTIPEGHLAYGAPAETRPLSDEQRREIVETQEHYVELGREYRTTESLE